MLLRFILTEYFNRKKALMGRTARRSAKEKEPVVRGSRGSRAGAGPELCTGEGRRFPR